MWNIETRNGYFTDKRDTPVRLWFNGEGVGSVRPSVAAFALLMEAQLQAHDDRPGWEADTPLALYERLAAEGGEVQEALLADMPPEIIGAETGDVGNFAMMIAQQAGGLAALLHHLRGE